MPGNPTWETEKIRENPGFRRGKNQRKNRESWGFPDNFGENQALNWGVYFVSINRIKIDRATP